MEVPMGSLWGEDPYGVGVPMGRGLYGVGSLWGGGPYRVGVPMGWGGPIGWRERPLRGVAYEGGVANEEA